MDDKKPDKPGCFGTYIEGQFAPGAATCERACAFRAECKTLHDEWTAGARRYPGRAKRLVTSPENIKRLYDQGASYAKISELVRVEEQYVRGTLKALGVMVRAPGPREVWKDRRAEIKRTAPWGKGRGNTP